MIPFVIDGQPVEGKEDGNVLEVALDAGLRSHIFVIMNRLSPTVPAVSVWWRSSRQGRTRMTTSCTYPVLEGIEVFTQTEKVLRARRMIIELILAMCPGDKLIQEMAKEMGVQQVRFKQEDKDCILCGLCGRICEEVVGAHAIQFAFRGDRREMIPPFAGRGDELHCLRSLCGGLSCGCHPDERRRR